MSSDGCLLPCVASPQDVADRLHNQTERVLEVTETIRQLCQSQNLGLAQVPRGVMALAAPVLWLMASEVESLSCPATLTEQLPPMFWLMGIVYACCLTVGAKSLL